MRSSDRAEPFMASEAEPGQRARRSGGEQGGSAVGVARGVQRERRARQGPLRARAVQSRNRWESRPGDL